ncbi:MAG: DUF2852 domain-containing protein [Thiothrix sp.]
MSPDISANGSSSSPNEGGCCHHWRGRGFHPKRGNWSCFNIFAMVLGFVLFWPIGLVILFWILKGNNVRDLPQAIQGKWRSFNGKSSGKAHHAASDNTVFNEYQQTQWDRIQEIETEIHERDQRFGKFRDDAKRRADEQEFRDFMDKQPEADSEKDSK